MKVVVFGVFDLFHLGHKYFLQTASCGANEVHIILTTDNIVKMLKNKTPNENYNLRKKNIIDYFTSINVSCIVHECDQELGTYKVLREIVPDIIYFGYDQTGLSTDLIGRLNDFIKENKIKIVTVESFQAEKYKTSILENTYIRNE